MDQNDNPPVFISSIFYGSVLQSGSTDQLAAELVIELILSVTFGYDAFVDSMSPTAGADNTTRDSVVEVHFVNSSLTLKAASANPGNLVSPNIIESMASSALTSAQLQDAMRDIGLELYQVGDQQIDDEDSLEAQLLTYQIVLGVVALVLLSIVFLLATAYCVRTRKLERRVKVLTTNTFGSQASDLNKTGVTAAPNSNLFKGEGTNPMFNISLQEFNNQDNRSISSGDSVLVGVEDNPEFQDYKVDQGRNSKADAPTFVGADGIASNNPLFSVQHSAPARPNESSDAGSFEDGDLGSPNPNFVFQ
ncbi:hypothetical protein FHG87_008878 [Trinorchestia longiramus]|nr:hypothetical protein FHG87_008878 [Trinorchestia longiramus]